MDTFAERSPALIRGRSGSYIATRPILSEAEILAVADEIVERRFHRGATLISSEETIRFLRSKLALLEEETFGALLFDSRRRVIAWRVLFRGTVDGCSVHPRAVLRQCLADNAAAVILAHQHPSGVAEPSSADVQITRRLREALALIDVPVLDHIVIGGIEAVSMVQRGLL